MPQRNIQKMIKVVEAKGETDGKRVVIISLSE